MTPHVWPVRVYYEDTDFSGVVYHANYLRFLERGRTEFLRQLGIDQAALLRENGLGFVVRHMAIDFVKPARMDDRLDIETAVRDVGGASIHLAQRVLRGADVLIAAGVKIAVLRNGRVARLPADIGDRFRVVSGAG